MEHHPGEDRLRTSMDNTYHYCKLNRLKPWRVPDLALYAPSVYEVYVPMGHLVERYGAGARNLKGRRNVNYRARHRLPGAQTRGLRPLPIPGRRCFPPCTLPLGLRRPQEVAMANGRPVPQYVRILHLAATTMESTVDSALSLLLEAGEPFDYATVKELANPAPPRAPVLTCPGCLDLRVYDSLLAGVA